MSVHRKITSQKISGFTLVEIQIALILLVMIMGLLFGALYMASKSWKVGQAQNELTEEKRLVAEFLRRQFSQITPLSWQDNRGSALIFRGHSDAVLYVGKLPANRSTGGLSLLELITRDDESSKRLELGYERLDPDQTPFDTTDETMKHTLVLDQIKTIQFQYFGQQKFGSDPAEWSDQWEANKRLPKLIKCQITMTSDESWPEMIFPIHTNSSNGLRQLTLQASQGRFARDDTEPRLPEDVEQDIEELF